MDSDLRGCLHHNVLSPTPRPHAILAFLITSLSLTLALICLSDVMSLLQAETFFDDGFTQRIYRGHFGTAVWDEAKRLAPLAQCEDTWRYPPRDRRTPHFKSCPSKMVQ